MKHILETEDFLFVLSRKYLKQTYRQTHYLKLV